jgi:GNAT superfamily N-acetyltransferase
MSLRIRPIHRQRDRAAACAIDTSFETDQIYEVVAGARSLELALRQLAAPRAKRYPMADAFAAWSTWDTGWVAEIDGAVCGIAAVEHEAWHARLVLWHLYVTRPRRRDGVGRALLAAAEEHGRGLGARTVWLETTTVNVPGIAAYERLGYRLCGVDTTLYDTLPYEDEAAVYLSKRIT